MHIGSKNARKLAWSLLPCYFLQSSRAYSLTPVVRDINAAGVYLHIPFCRRRCYYCDFPVKVVGEKASAHRLSGQYYTDLLVKDIEHWSRVNSAEGTKVDTVYFGGGTPSLLPDECIKAILDKLRDTYQIQDKAEISLEMDPGTFTYERLLSLREYGVNRISMGVQSFDNKILKKCGRPHTVEDTYRALDELHRANWENFSIDIISSLPHLTPELWQDTLQKAVAAGSSHISVYDLQIEPKTAFGRWYTPNEYPLPSETISTEMYSTAVRTLNTAGFEHYEVSNYALPGRRSRHNQKYWSLAPVHAFGMAAVSYLRGERFARPKSMKEYENYVQDLVLSSALTPPGLSLSVCRPGAATEGTRYGEQAPVPVTTSYSAPTIPAGIVVSPAPASASVKPDMLEALMLSLRTADGLHLPHFAHVYGTAAAEKVIRALAPYETRGLVEYKSSAGSLVDYGLLCGSGAGAQTCARTGSANGGDTDKLAGSVRLSDPEGFLLSNDIISSVFSVFDDVSDGQQ